MKWTTTIVLILILFISCDRKTDFQNDYTSKIILTDRVELKVISDGQKKSIIIDDKERLEFLKSILKPKDLIPKQLTDDLNLPINIFLYSQNEVIGQMGIQYGHIQCVYYKGEESYDFKMMINDDMDKFIELINRELRD